MYSKYLKSIDRRTGQFYTYIYIVHVCTSAYQIAPNNPLSGILEEISNFGTQKHRLRVSTRNLYLMRLAFEPKYGSKKVMVNPVQTKIESIK